MKKKWRLRTFEELCFPLQALIMGASVVTMWAFYIFTWAVLT